MSKQANSTAWPRPAEVLLLDGSDATAFAQAQLASRIGELKAGRWQWTAWLDAHGKVRMLGMAWRREHGFGILLRGGGAEQLRAALQPYVLRAQVRLQADASRMLRAGPAAPSQQLSHARAGLSFGLGHYSLQLDAQAEDEAGHAAEAGALDPDLEAIRAGHPWLPEATLQTFLPPALNLYELGAVALGKGCYPGQEMVNRLHTRGGHKYGLAHVRTQADWQQGEALAAHGHNAGHVLARAGDEALIVARDADLEALPDTQTLQQFGKMPV